uniref:Uncharacterized protein n=1 Tax=Trypanosoma congolense (strain IL3000) TaxID=1068625 RepID=G0UK71_TRYCI|nr:conserved hypothetical protein [Trypanosoma congolense IL3000]
MSVFVDNPFADDDAESTSLADPAGRKRLRGDDEDGVALPEVSAFDPESQRHSESLLLPEPGATSITSSRCSDTAPRSEKGDEATGFVPVAALLADYDAGLEEDEYNFFVVKAAGLETEISKLSEEYSAELLEASKSNDGLQESVDLLRETIFRVRQELQLRRRSKESLELQDQDGRSLHDEVALTGLTQVVERDRDALRELAMDDSQRFAHLLREHMGTSSTAKQIGLCFTGELAESPDLSAWDFSTERHLLEASRVAASELGADGWLGDAVAVVHAMMEEVSRRLQECEKTHADIVPLCRRVTEIASSLRELSRGSLEWWNHTWSRIFVDGSFACGSKALAPEVRFKELDIKQMAATLEQLDSVIARMQLSPNITSLLHENAPGVKAVALSSLCQQMESEVEVLGLEVLRLRNLLTVDTDVLIANVGESQTSHQGVDGGGGSDYWKEKNKWLTALSHALLKQNSSAESLFKTLREVSDMSESPVAQLQIMFYQSYVDMQGALVRSLTALNCVLQERSRVIENIRQVTLLGGCAEAVAFFGESSFQESETGVDALLEEMKECVDSCLRKFGERASRLLQELASRRQQNVGKLLELRRFFVEAVSTSDTLAYGEEGSKELRHVLQSALDGEELLISSDSSQEPKELPQLTCIPDESGIGDILDTVANDHREDLQEEVRYAHRRNEELNKRKVWLAMQPNHKALVELLGVRKDIKAERHKLAVAAQREAKWMSMKETLEAKRRQLLAAQAAVSEKQSRLNDLQQQLAEATYVQS